MVDLSPNASALWPTLRPCRWPLPYSFCCSFLAWRVSGLYLSMSLKSWVAVCLSRVWLNWLIGGGTFSLVWRTAFWRCGRMYLGHLTNLERSLLGWMACPIPKFRVLFSKRGLTTLFTSGFLTARGAAATFFPFFLAFF